MKITSIHTTRVISKRLGELLPVERERLSAVYRVGKGLTPYSTDFQVNIVDQHALERAFYRRSFVTLAGVLEYLKEVELDHLVYVAEERQRPNEL